jgi:hypothetical protein
MTKVAQKRKYKSVNIYEGTHHALIDCAAMLSEEHGFTISQAKAIQILLYRFFHGTSSYKKYEGNSDGQR